jgi:cytochrome d ubiquinol oxidase subunit I
LAFIGIFTLVIQTLLVFLLFTNVKKSGNESHLTLTLLVAISSMLFVYPVLAANAFMNHPVGTSLDPATAHNVITGTGEVLFSPFAIHKYLHTVSSGCVVACLFVMGISARFLLKKKNTSLATKSMIISSVFGLLSSLFVSLTGDTSTYQVAQHQPMKLAAMEGLFKGQTEAPLVAFGFLNDNKKPGDSLEPFHFKIEIPSMLSKLATRDRKAFVPGIEDLFSGNYLYGIESVSEKMDRGTSTIIAQTSYLSSLKKGDSVGMNLALSELKQNYSDIGYGYLDKPEKTIPYVHIVFNSFHSMVLLGFFFIFLFVIFIIQLVRRKAGNIKLFLWIAVLSLPLGYFAFEMGWVLSETGRQPWVLHEIIPVNRIVQTVSLSSIKTSFILFSCLYAVLIFLFIRLSLKHIKAGPEK